MTKYKKGQTGELKLGYDRKSFHKDIVGYKYDKTSDHNIVELIEVNNK